MRPFTNQQTRLAVVTGLIILGGATYFLASWMQEKTSQWSAEAVQLEEAHREGQNLLDGKEAWMARQGWLQQHAPVCNDSKNIPEEWFQLPLDQAQEHGLIVVDQAIDPSPVHGVNLTSVSEKVRVQGSMENLCQWLSALQTPENFYAVTEFSVRASDNQNQVACFLTITRYFKEKL